MTNPIDKVLAAALNALALGLRPIPIGNDKKPLVKWEVFQERAPSEGEVAGWWRDFPNANVGIVTGTEDGVTVIDFDPGHEPFPKEGYEMPVGCVVSTPRGGRHYYTKHIPGVRNSASKLARHIDVRSEGGYIVIPPSINNGKSYSYEVGSLREALSTEAPDWLVSALRACSSAKKNSEKIPGRIAEGARNATLTSLAGTMRRRGASQEAIEQALLAENRKCSPPLPTEEVRQIAHSVARYAPAQNYDTTDLGNSLRFVDEFGQDFLFCERMGGWLYWDSRRWKSDETLQTMERAKEIPRIIFEESQHCADSGRQKSLAKWAAASQHRARIDALVSLARSSRAVAVEDFDTDPWLLNLLNGTIDLHSGELRPARREDLITKLAPVNYEPTAECPGWLKFLDRVMDGNSGKIGFLQRLLGMCLTGDVSEQKLFIFWGDGSNGKNTLLEAVDGVLGDYSTLAAPDLLILRKHSEHKTEIADLAGRRLVAASESGEGRRLNENFVKNLTGDNKLKGRYIGRDFFEFPRTFKLILRTNHRPHIRETTHAIWRRISLVPFTVIIPSKEQDKKLGDKLKAEYPGILNWLIQGCLDWQHNGLKEPLEVRQATEEYQSEQDPVVEFLSECLLAPNARIARTRLYAAYLSWTQRNSEHFPLRRKDFYAHLRGKGYAEETAKVEGKSERIFCGIALPEREEIDVGRS